MMQETLLFPMNFKSDIKREIMIDESKLSLRKMTDKEIFRFFNIIVTERYENGLIKSMKTGKDFNLFTEPLSAILIDHSGFVMSSQFLLETKEMKYAKWFQQALKLHKDGKNGVFYGVSSSGRSIHFLHPIPFYGKKVYSIEEDDIPKIKELYKTIKSTESKRYDLLIEKFLFALSGLSIGNNHRFLELTTILEMLYSPRDARTELSFRFSLRACKVLSKYHSLDEEQTYKDLRKIYTIRSSISHSGSHSETGEYLDKLIDYTRKSIVLFLKDPSIFEDNRLDELCIKNWSLSREKKQ